MILDKKWLRWSFRLLIIPCFVCSHATMLRAAELGTNPNPGLNKLPEASAETPERRESMIKYSTTSPESNTLPEGVMRLRFPVVGLSGHDGYSKSGKKSDTGYNLHATAGGVVAEYGITPNVSGQVLVPIILRNELHLDRSAFKKTEVYNTNYQNFVGAAAASIGARLINTDTAAETAAAFPGCVGTTKDEIMAKCSQWIAAGNSGSADLVVKNPNTGAVLGTIPAGVPINAALEETILVGASQKVEDGKTGLGDVELGVLYKFLDTGRIFSAIGLGLRLPTGSFRTVEATQRPTGRGTVDLGLRYNVDVAATEYLLFAFQNQLEQMLMKGRKDLAPGVTKDYTREGVRNQGFFAVKYALGQLAASLNFIGLMARYDYDYDADTKIAGLGKAEGAQKQAANFTVLLSGLDHKIPMQAEFFYTQLLGAKNTAIGTNQVGAIAKLFYKF